MTIHAGLAGLLCTTALILAAIELSSSRLSGRAGWLFVPYSIGTAIWTITGIVTDSFALVLISTIQTAAAFYCVLQSKLKGS